MSGHHDVGGRAHDLAIDRSEHVLADWELLTDAINQALAVKGIRRTDELRRAVEELDERSYVELSYYERWAAATEALLVEKGLVSRAEVDARSEQLAADWS